MRRIRAARPAEAGQGWVRRLAGYCWRYRRNTIIAIGASLVAALVTAVIPLVQRRIIDNVIVTHTESIWPLAIALVVAALATFGAVYVRRYMGGRVSLDVQHDLRTELLGSLSRLDGARQDELHTGQVVSRSISDLNMVQGLLSIIPVTAGNLVLFAASLVIMLFLSPLLTVVALLVGPALYLVTLASRRRLFPSSWDAQQQSGAVAGVVEAAVTGVRVVKGFGQEEQELDRLEESSRRLFASRVRTVRLMARYSPALQAIPAFGQIGVLALGGWLAIHGSITLGTFLAFSSYLAQMAGPVRMLTYLITLGQEARASVIRVFEVIDSRPLITEKPGAATLPADASGVEFDDVHFGYAPEQPVLNGLTLRAEPGETLAIIGASGSGKSTLSLLLARFYDVDSGAVRIGGHDVRDVTLDSLRSAIGLVLEDSFLFSDTVRANVAFGRPEATDEQVIAAARAAEAEEFITDLPDGYDTVIGEQGLSLSGGQRQRIALARALLTDPRILVLDDATSSIDPRMEAEIHDTLRRVMRGRTTLLIAHRRSTLQLADRIAVLHEGRVADVGRHEELMLRSPRYRLLLAGPDEAGIYDGEDAEPYDGEDAVPAGAAGAVALAARRGGLPPGPRRRPGPRGGAGHRRPAAAVAATAGTACWPASRRAPSCWPSWTRCRRRTTSRTWTRPRRARPSRGSPCASCSSRSSSRWWPASSSTASTRWPPWRCPRWSGAASTTACRPRRSTRSCSCRWSAWPSCSPTGWSTSPRPWSSGATASGCCTRCGSRSSRTCSGSGSISTSGNCPAGS